MESGYAGRGWVHHLTNLATSIKQAHAMLDGGFWHVHSLVYRTWEGVHRIFKNRQSKAWRRRLDKFDEKEASRLTCISAYATRGKLAS
jgi:hypothetical protein